MKSMRVSSGVEVSGLTLCSCGSGLKHASCCGLTDDDLHAASARETAPLRIDQLDLMRSCDFEFAARACIGNLDADPVQPFALRRLCEIRLTHGPESAAETLLKRIVSLDPNDFKASMELALLLLRRGSLWEAEQHARNTVRIAPTHPQSHNLMGMILTEAQRPALGEFHYRRVLQLTNDRDPILLANLAWSLKGQGRMVEARELYRESVALAPNILQTLLGWARLEETDREFDACTEILDRADQLFPDHPSILLTRAVLLGRTGDHAGALAILGRIAESSETGDLGVDELLEKGALLDSIGRHQEAFAAFNEGKKRLREASGLKYLADQADAQFQRLSQFFVASRLDILPRAGPLDTSAQPIFIVGFPRSGTTLVEQILSAHPNIAAGDELPFISELADIMPRLFGSPLAYPEALAELWMADHRDGLDELRDHYMRRVSQLGFVNPGITRFTDKMPLNETHMGLIHLCFPEAPIVHLVRHPLDVVLSVFSNQLTHGFFCAFELETAAMHLAATMDLVEHYRREIDLHYLQVRYEDIVDDHEETVRSIVAFVGEKFDAACLRFDRNRRYARTASYAQVTRRLYRHSRFRYRNYLKQLEPVIPILAPVIERLGYSIDHGFAEAC